MSWYDVLGVPADASDEIRHAYLAKAKLLHPDRLAGAPPEVADAANAAMALLNEARRVLEDRAVRARYDAAGAGASVAPAPPMTAPSRPADRHSRSPAARAQADDRRSAYPGLRPPTAGPSGSRSVASEHGGPTLVAALLASLEVVADWLGPHPRPSRHVIVPEFRRHHVSECFYMLADTGLHPRIVRLTAHPAPVDGVIVDQSPAAGSRVRRNSVVTLKVWHPAAASAAPDPERAP